MRRNPEGGQPDSDGGRRVHPPGKAGAGGRARRPAPPVSEKPGKSGASRGAGSATAAKTAEEDPEEMKTYGAAESEEDADRNGGIERKRRNRSGNGRTKEQQS